MRVIALWCVLAVAATPIEVKPANNQDATALRLIEREAELELELEEVRRGVRQASQVMIPARFNVLKTIAQQRAHIRRCDKHLRLQLVIRGNKLFGQAKVVGKETLRNVRLEPVYHTPGGNRATKKLLVKILKPGQVWQGWWQLEAGATEVWPNWQATVGTGPEAQNLWMQYSYFTKLQRAREKYKSLAGPADKEF